MRGLFVLREALRVAVAGDFRRGRFAEHGEDEFQVAHVVAEILALELFEFGVFGRRQAECGLGNFSGEDGVFGCSRTPRFFHSSVSSSRMAMERIRFSIQSAE